jgi:hypothetical protein
VGASRPRARARARTSSRRPVSSRLVAFQTTSGARRGSACSASGARHIASTEFYIAVIQTAGLGMLHASARTLRASRTAPRYESDALKQRYC